MVTVRLLVVAHGGADPLYLWSLPVDSPLCHYVFFKQSELHIACLMAQHTMSSLTSSLIDILKLDSISQANKRRNASRLDSGKMATIVILYANEWYFFCDNLPVLERLGRWQWSLGFCVWRSFPDDR